MTGSRLAAGIAALVLLSAIPAIALSGSGHFEGKIGKAVLSMETAVSHGKVTKVKDFVWDGLECGGGDHFTAGLSKSVKVKNHKFESTQPVGGAAVPLKVHVKGRFTNNDTKATGYVNVKAPCSTGSKKWTASAR